VKSITQLCAVCGLLSFIFSCKQKTDYTREISRLDSASAALEIAEKSLLRVDTAALRTSYNTLSASLHELTEKISKDTVKKKTALLLSAAYEQAEHIHTLLENKKYFERAIRESRQRLNDLEHDLAANLIDKNQSQKYIANEMNAFQKICNAVNQALAKTTIAKDTLDSFHTGILFLKDSLTKCKR
jgi:hypothetical protein